MTQTQDDPIHQAISYMRYQGAKSFEDLTVLLERTEKQWAGKLEGMSEQQATFQPQGEWCAKEVINHLITANRGINQTIADMAGVESPHKTERAKAMGEMSDELTRLSIAELRGEVGDVFREITQLMTSLQGNDKLDQQFPHPIFGPLNLKEWFAFHRVHAMDHIGQIDQIKADPAYPSA